jgi:hypothetical protein
MKPTSGESAAAMDFVNSRIWLSAIVVDGTLTIANPFRES